MKCCAVVPVYNHEHAVGAVVAALRAHGMPVLMVDDGSRPECAAVLDRLAAADAGVTLLRRAQNGGKGAAAVSYTHLRAHET